MNRTCARCSKVVYPIEELKCLDKTWHKTCFKCTECGMALNMKTYKGFNKLPYCEAHIPKAKATAIADTPELKRIAENTKIQSNVKYHADFEKAKGKFTQVADDPEMLRIKQNTKIISNVAYHGDLEKKAAMERQRNTAEVTDCNAPPNYLGLKEKEETVSTSSSTGTTGAEQLRSSILANSHNPAGGTVLAGTINEANAGHIKLAYGEGTATSAATTTSLSPGSNINAKYNNNKNNGIPPPPRSPKTKRTNAGQELNSEDSSNHYGSTGGSDLKVLYSNGQQNGGGGMTTSNIATNAIYPNRIGSVADIDPANGVYGSLVIDNTNSNMLANNNHQHLPTQVYYSSHQYPGQGGGNSGNSGGISGIATQTPKKNAKSSMKVYRALYDYEAQDSDEVSFLEGDIIFEVEAIDSGWMTGRVESTGKIGMLPANYVEQTTI